MRVAIRSLIAKRLHPRKTLRTVLAHFLLLRRVPKVGVELAQEDVQGPDLPIQRPGARDGPTSVVVGFLLPDPAYS